jgi:hypothetical protein
MPLCRVLVAGMLLPVAAWRNSVSMLEGVGEGVLRSVADLPGNPLQGSVTLLKHTSGNAQPPPCQVGQGWLSDEVSEAAREGGPGQTGSSADF